MILPLFVRYRNLLGIVCPDSSGVEHLHGKQAVVGSIPILGKTEKKIV